MDFIDREKRRRLASRELRVPAQDANLLAQFHLYSGVASRARGFEGLERNKLPVRPQIIYDLSGLPLFYDFPTRKGRGQAGFIRIAANKVLGAPVVSTQVNPPGWDMSVARARFDRLLETKYGEYTRRITRLVCYSYPKLALSAELVSPDGHARMVLMDVGDFSEIPPEPGPIREALGQIPYSVLNEITEQREQEGPEVWNVMDREVKDLFRREEVLQPARLYQLAPEKRLDVISNRFVELELLRLFSQKVLDYCCHSGPCRDHECFCLHPQENGVHCARASAQMMLCWWRYCFSQHQIAQAFGVQDNQLTPVGAVVPGLESLTNNCFDATMHWPTDWSICWDEISERRPFMSCVPGHARACAGAKRWNLWIYGLPQPRWLYIFDPWPPNVGAISWENYNTANHMCMYTLKRRTTNHA
jgi:hypothetical protein